MTGKNSVQDKELNPKSPFLPLGSQWKKGDTLH